MKESAALGSLRKLLVALLLASLALTSILAQAEAQGPRGLLAEAYEDVVEAARTGGDVKELVEDLNRALNLIRQAEAAPNSVEASALNQQALELLNRVVSVAPKVAEEGARARLLDTFMLALTAALLVVGGYAAYRHGPTLYLKLWVRFKAKHRVKKVGGTAGGEHGSMVLSQEVWGVVLAIVLVGSILAFTQAYFAGRVVEPFSELGILGPKAKLADYPTKVVAGDTIKLYLYVGNHLGYPAYYKVLVKLGNKTSQVDPAPLPSIATYEVILNHNSTWLHPIELKLTKPGERQRLIFELWIYNLTTKSFTYHKRWCQLWIDVVPPP